MSHASRRSLLAAMGAVAIGGAQKRVAIPDPIFSALEEYQRASRAWSAEYGKLDDHEFFSPGYYAQEEIAGRANEVVAAALEKLEVTVPTTAAGAAAVLAFIFDDDPSWACDWHETLVGNVAETLERLAG